MPAFVAFGFSVQFLLLAFFVTHRWRPSLESRLGRLVYGWASSPPSSRSGTS